MKTLKRLSITRCCRYLSLRCVQIFFSAILKICLNSLFSLSLNFIPTKSQITVNFPTETSAKSFKTYFQDKVTKK